MRYHQAILVPLTLHIAYLFSMCLFFVNSGPKCGNMDPYLHQVLSTCPRLQSFFE